MDFGSVLYFVTLRGYFIPIALVALFTWRALRPFRTSIKERSNEKKNEALREKYGKK